LPSHDNLSLHRANPPKIQIFLRDSFLFSLVSFC
jgi:hypothetical protein